MYKEIGKDSEVEGTLKAAGDAHIVDVTNEFVGSHGIVDITSRDVSTDGAYCSVPANQDANTASSQQIDTEVGRLSESVASLHVQDVVEPGSSTEIELAIILGGMDTAGEIFDDCLVFSLTPSRPH